MVKGILYSEQTKTNIMDAFWKLFEAHPLHEITVREVTEKAGYSRNTFYYHFRSIRDVLDAIEEDVLNQTDRMYLSLLEADGHLPPSVDDLVRISAESEELHHKYLPVLFAENGDPLFHEKLRVHYLKYLKAYFPDKLGQDTVESEMMAEFYTSGLIGAMNFLGKNYDRLSFREMVEIIYRTFRIQAWTDREGSQRTPEIT